MISGSACVCNGGIPCTQVGGAVNAANITSAVNSAVANAAEVANNAVANAMNAANAAVANAAQVANNAVSNAVGDGDSSCPQHGDGQGGSRCGTVDLVGYCEDSCGSGDDACCVNNKPVCAC